MSHAETATHATPPAVLRLMAVWCVLCTIIAVSGGWFALVKVIDHDVGYWLIAAGRLLDGARLYRDMIELNPPVYYALAIIPVALARALGTLPVPTFHALVFLVAIAAAVASVRVAQRALHSRPLFARLLALPVLFAFLIHPGPDLGQREHLLAMFLLPYLIVVASDNPLRVAWPTRLAIGAVAGLGIAFKPYFALYLVVGEAIVLLRSRDPRLLLRADLAAAVTVIVTAAAGTVLFFPEYLDFIVPLGREIYHGYEIPFAEAMTSLAMWWTATVCTVALLVAQRLSDRGARDLVHVLVAAAGAAVVAYAVQRKGWSYQSLPAVMFATIALGAGLVSKLESAFARRRAPRFALVTVGFATMLPAAFLMLYNFGDTIGRRRAFAPLVQIVAQAAPHHALFLSSHLLYAFPVLNHARASWPYRYHHLLPLPGLYRDFDPAAAGAPFRPPEQMGPTEARFFATVVEDALRFPPQLLLVDRNPQFTPLSEMGFDFLAYFRQDARFAHLADEFRYAGHVLGHDLFVRAETGSARAAAQEP